jgi:hypothetical protein
VPYARGGHHFSNGATWSERLARDLGAGGSAQPGFKPSGTGTNYAVGAARAYEDGVNVNLPAQVAAFLTHTGGAAPSDALYVIEMGGNDVRDALAAFPAGSGADHPGREYFDREQHPGALRGGRQGLHGVAHAGRGPHAGAQTA